jgi:hypothetical protein
MKRRVAFASLLVIGLAIATSPLWARVGTVTLKELVDRSDLIVLATETKVEHGPTDFKIEGEVIPSPQVATARVLEVWKGNADPEVRYLASPTWPCDISQAKVGERVVLFLMKPPDWPFWAIADSGRGRMPIRDVAGKAYATIYTGDVLLPKGITTIPGAKPKYEFIRSVELNRLKWSIVAMGRTNTLIAASAGTFSLAGLTWFFSSHVRLRTRTSALPGDFDTLDVKLLGNSRFKSWLRVIAKVELLAAVLIAFAVLWCRL